MRVIVESPFMGANRAETLRNIKYAQLCMKDSLERGEQPFLSHLLYTQVWSESPDFRRRRIDAGLAWGELAEKRIVYTDLGITEGMRKAIRAPKPADIDFRRLGILADDLLVLPFVPFAEIGTVMLTGFGLDEERMLGRTHRKGQTALDPGIKLPSFTPTKWKGK